MGNPISRKQGHTQADVEAAGAQAAKGKQAEIVTCTLKAIAQLDRYEGHEFLIEPANGQFSGEKHYVNPDTRYAFIAAGRDDAAAVDLKSIETEFGALGLPLFSLCFGRIRPGAEPYFGLEHSNA